MLKYCTKCFPFMVLYAVLEHPRRFKLDQCPCGPFSNFSYSPQSHLVRRNYARRYYLSYKKRFYWQFLLIHNVRFLHLLKVIIMSTSHHKSIFVRLEESKHQNFRHPDHSLSPISFWNTTCYPEGIVIRRPPPPQTKKMTNENMSTQTLQASGPLSSSPSRQYEKITHSGFACLV